MLAALKDKLASGLTLVLGWLLAGFAFGLWLANRGRPKPDPLRKQAQEETAAAEAIKPEVVPDDIEKVKDELRSRGLVK